MVPPSNDLEAALKEEHIFTVAAGTINGKMKFYLFAQEASETHVAVSVFFVCFVNSVEWVFSGHYLSKLGR